MKAIGFFKNHNPDILCAGDIVFNPQVNSRDTLDGVIAYLQKGTIITAFTLSLFDTDGEFIGPYMIFSDGEWIWPSYYSFYLRKFNSLFIPPEFVFYTRSKRQPNELAKGQLIYLEYIVSKLIGVDLKNISIPPMLKQMIADNGDTVTCY